MAAMIGSLFVLPMRKSVRMALPLPVPAPQRRRLSRVASGVPSPAVLRGSRHAPAHCQGPTSCRRPAHCQGSSSGNGQFAGLTQHHNRRQRGRRGEGRAVPAGPRHGGVAGQLRPRRPSPRERVRMPRRRNDGAIWWISWQSPCPRPAAWHPAKHSPPAVTWPRSPWMRRPEPLS
jgi:hypothetical protein